MLKVANAALRFRPPSSSDDKKSAPAGRQPGGKEGKGASASVGTGKLWVLDADGKPAAIEVKTGISDGSQTELLDGAIAAGREVIVGTVAAGKPKVASPRMF